MSRNLLGIISALAISLMTQSPAQGELPADYQKWTSSSSKGVTTYRSGTGPDSKSIREFPVQVVGDSSKYLVQGYAPRLGENPAKTPLEIYIKSLGSPAPNQQYLKSNQGGSS